ncbi:MAG: hypothetical protein LBS59_08685 [Puniceicoccales bacterium]|jgi:Trk-type K+ transport system membrane component|nr:hypothetical protein [Puniceicoccales bacterium]
MSHLIPVERRSLLLHVLNGVLVLCGLSALGVFVLLLGWSVPEAWGASLDNVCRIVFGVFVTQEIFRILLQTRPLNYLFSHKIEGILTVLASLQIFAGESFWQWIHSWLNMGISARDFTLFYLAVSQVTLLILLGLRWLRGNHLLSHRRLSPGLVFMLSFALLITVGTLLLKTPRATPNGIGWADALFTATSAVCVTGLSTLETATAFTRHGQWIILCLVQIGGLGVMTFTYFFAYFLAGGVSLRNRFALQDLLSEDNLGQIGTVLGTIIVFTFGCEIAGAVAIYSQLETDTGSFFNFFGMFGVDAKKIPSEEHLFFSIFHSVMAFCNAGFSTLKGNLANPAMSGRDGILVVLMVLAFAGGAGFPVVKNCWQTFLASVLRKMGLRFALPPRLSTNTKIVLVTTLTLGIFGTLGIFATEFLAGGANVGGGHNPWLAAMFDATTSRTAGFTISTQSLFTPATTIVIMFLMFVGGSPSSTAGGIKTTTLAVAFLSLRRILLGREEIEVFGRRLDDAIAHRALATIFVALAFITLVTMTLCLLHPNLPAIDLGFEAISAVCTAGMSRDITPRLGDAAKIVLVVAMFAGRVGVLTCLLAFMPRRESSPCRLPRGEVVIN